MATKKSWRRSSCRVAVFIQAVLNIASIVCNSTPFLQHSLKLFGESYVASLSVKAALTLLNPLLRRNILERNVMDKNFLKAIIITLLLMFVWERLDLFGKTVSVPLNTNVSTQKFNELSYRSDGISKTTHFLPDTSSTLPSPTPMNRQALDFEEKNVQIAWQDARVQIGNLGGRIKEIYLDKFKETLVFKDPSQSPLALLRVGTIKHIENQVPEISDSVNIKAAGADKSVDAVNLKLTLPSGIEVIRLIEKTDKDFFFKMRLIVKNVSAQDIYFQDGVEISLGTLSLPEKSQYPTLTFNHYTANNIVESLDYKKVTGEQKTEEIFQWAGIQNSTYCSILSESENMRALLWKHEKDSKSISGSASTEDFVLAPSQEKIFNFNYYLGPKFYFHLQSLHLSFEHIIDYGAILGGITKPLVLFLNYLKEFCGSYGFAILLLTFCFKIVTYPLTKKAIVSSMAMMVLQPEMKRLQEKYKSDPKQLQMAMMQLYKENKVNPMSGCFPILIQMPIFIAFFKALSTSVELNGASFWLIQDLALPDRLIPLGAFSVNVLPLILAATQWMSSKQSITDPKQKNMILMMTVFLTVIFYSMPSGLNLYFLASNLIGIAQTHWIKKVSRRASAKVF